MNLGSYDVLRFLSDAEFSAKTQENERAKEPENHRTRGLCDQSTTGPKGGTA